MQPDAKFVFPDGGDSDYVGRAYAAQRERLAQMRPGLAALVEAVDYPSNLWPYQWAQLVAVALEFKPDLIIELGRGRGNSTCAFGDALAALGHGRLVSYCLSKDWATSTESRIRPLRDVAWFSRLDIRTGDITRTDWRADIGDARRVLVFWDAHGFAVAGSVLGSMAPVLAQREHFVAMHDISDARFNPTPAEEYRGAPGWSGGNEGDPKFRIGHIHSGVEQAIAILDFSTRNDMPVHSADESIHRVIEQDAAQAALMRESLGEFYNPLAHWHWFRLSEARRSLDYPRAPQPLPWTIRLRLAAKLILNR